jgi:hypothetical protein
VTQKVTAEDFLVVIRAADGGLVHLAGALHMMLDTLTSWPDTVSRERGVILNAMLPKDCPKEHRRIVKVVFEALWKIKVGRPKADGGRTYRKADALLMLYAWEKSQNPKMSDRKFAFHILKITGETVSKVPTRRDAQINKITKRLREARKLKAELDSRGTLPTAPVSASFRGSLSNAMAEPGET